MGPTNNIPALVHIRARHRPGNKPLPEPMVVSLLTHICVTRPQWVHQVINKHTKNNNAAIQMQYISAINIYRVTRTYKINIGGQYDMYPRKCSKNQISSITSIWAVKSHKKIAEHDSDTFVIVLNCKPIWLMKSAFWAREIPWDFISRWISKQYSQSPQSPT